MITVHMLYLDSRFRVCERPDLIETEPVISDFGSGSLTQSCPNCMEVITHSNMKAFAKETEEALKVGRKHRGEPTPLHEFHRGIAWGLVFSVPIWSVIFLLLWVVFFRG